MGEENQLDKIKTHHLFNQLTEGQKQFVLKFIETNGDGVLAVHSAYPKITTPYATHTTLSKLLGNWKVRRILAWYGGYSFDGSPMSQTEAVQLISDRLRSPDTDTASFTKMIVLLADINGWASVKGKKANVTLTTQEENESESVDKLVLALEEKQKKAL